MFSTMPASIQYIRAGNLRPLAVTTATRWAGLSDVPTVGDFVPSYEANTWYGVGAPKNTPAEIIDKLNKEINAGLPACGKEAPFRRRRDPGRWSCSWEAER
jgi:tripartite-type tricarboxylate transporter receptor subunit TctC